MRGAWPRLGAPIVSLASAQPPPQPLLPAWQCNAQDGSIAQDGVTVDASFPCNWGLSAEAAATPSASCSGAELLAAIGGKELDDLPKYAKELTLKQLGDAFLWLCTLVACVPLLLLLLHAVGTTTARTGVGPTRFAGTATAGISMLSKVVLLSLGASRVTPARAHLH